jgi:hypothetical protein
LITTWLIVGDHTRNCADNGKNAAEQRIKQADPTLLEYIGTVHHALTFLRMSQTFGGASDLPSLLKETAAKVLKVRCQYLSLSNSPELTLECHVCAMCL